MESILLGYTCIEHTFSSHNLIVHLNFMKTLAGTILLLASSAAMGQVDTSYVYNASTPYGTLDIRLAKSATRYYYLQENKTFSFRESASGIKTDTYRDMTSWDSSPYSQGNLREKNGSADYFILNYRLLFPLNYQPTYNPGYPLIVMMHGAGERGNCWDTDCYWDSRSYKPNTNNPPAPTTSNHALLNNDHNLTHGGSPHLEARNLAQGKLPDDPTLNTRAFPGFVLFPQNLNGWDIGALQDAVRLIRLVVKTHNIDPDRIYIHGLSNGGTATYEAIKRAPWLFAAALPMSAPTDASIISKGLIPTVAHIPLWTFQGGRDTSPTPSRTASYVKQFKEAGADVRYSLYPSLGHGTWNTAYNEPDFFSWMLSKSKTKLHVFFNNPALCATTAQGVKMGFSAGFLAYAWQKDGVTIPGANGPEYVATEPGVYRARFSRKANPSEEDWNEWSQDVTVTVNDPGQAVIQVIGTHLMRGPDNNSAYNTVYLKSETTNDKYHWYKNDVLVNVPNTSLDDTTRVLKITASGSTANGSFTLKTEGFDNCPSVLSDSVNLYFANSAPYIDDTNIPGNFTGTVVSGSEVALSWTDNSAIEAGYEIWRRKPGNIFVLAGKTSTNITAFSDVNLEPSISYQYKIRAVTPTGRSRYAPSDNVNTNLVVTTLPDNEIPATPYNLHVTANTTSTISLAWTASTDNTGIRQYQVTYGDITTATNSALPQFTITGLPINTAYNITVVAEDLGGNFSAASNTAEGSTYVTGLIYGHSTGAWTDLDQITTWDKPEFTGTVANFTLAPRTQEDFFNFEFEGYLYINTGGDYRFRTTSDDGSRLTLNNEVIVNNDGTHGNVTVTSAVQTLGSGPQQINVRYFENTGGQSLTVQYRGPDTGETWVTIPDTALKSGNAPPTPEAPASEGYDEPLQPLEPLILNIFPNPSSSDNIYVQVASADNALVQVRLVDLMGRAYYQHVFTPDQILQETRITPDAPLLNGIYVIHVTQGDALVRKKIVIRN